MSPADWASKVAGVIAALDTPALAQALVDLLRQVVPFTHAVTFAYYGPDRQVSLHDDFPPPASARCLSRIIWRAPICSIPCISRR